MNSVPHLIQFSASTLTINPAWSYWVAYLPLMDAVNVKSPDADK
jgi:hypothetical protein